MTTAARQIALRHFGRAIVDALAQKGIRIRGLQALPTGKFAVYDDGYLIDDNGTGRVWRAAEVIATANPGKDTT